MKRIILMMAAVCVLLIGPNCAFAADPLNLGAEEIVEADPKNAEEIGTDWTLKQCEELFNFGVPGVHFFILQNVQPIQKLLSKLDI